MSPASGVSDSQAPFPIHAPTPLLPPISAPRIANTSFQRTIDDIAGRMNVLNAAFAHAQETGCSETLPTQGQYYRHPRIHAIGQYIAEGPRPPFRSSEEDRIPRNCTGGDKENVDDSSIGRRGPHYEIEEVSGLGLSKAHGGGIGKEMGNISYGTDQLHRAPTKDKKERKGKRKCSITSRPVHHD